MNTLQYSILGIGLLFIIIEALDRLDPLSFWKTRGEDWRKDRPMHFGPARYIARTWPSPYKLTDSISVTQIDPLIKVATTEGEEWQANPQYRVARTGKELDAWMAKRTAQLIAENEAVLYPWRLQHLSKKLMSNPDGIPIYQPVFGQIPGGFFNPETLKRINIAQERMQDAIFERYEDTQPPFTEEQMRQSRRFASFDSAAPGGDRSVIYGVGIGKNQVFSHVKALMDEAKLSDQELSVILASEIMRVRPIADNMVERLITDGYLQPNSLPGASPAPLWDDEQAKAADRIRMKQYHREVLGMPTEPDPITSYNEFRRMHNREPSQIERDAIDQNRERAKRFPSAGQF